MNIVEITDERGDSHIIIYKNETEFVSMPKAVYEELEAGKEKQSGTL